MSLPVNKFALLDPDLINPGKGNRFLLRVPRINVRPPRKCLSSVFAFRGLLPTHLSASSMQRQRLSQVGIVCLWTACSGSPKWGSNQILPSCIWRQRLNQLGVAQLLSVWLEPLVEVEVVASLGRVSIIVRPCTLALLRPSLTGRACDVLAR